LQSSCLDTDTYIVLEAHPEFSTYTLDLSNLPNIFPTFHVSQLRPYHANDPLLFTSREHPRPGPVVTEDGQLENFIDRIIDEQRVGWVKKYLIRWVGYGEEDDEWLLRRDLEDSRPWMYGRGVILKDDGEGCKHTAYLTRLLTRCRVLFVYVVV
jgi:hypothetical protein